MILPRAPAVKGSVINARRWFNLDAALEIAYTADLHGTWGPHSLGSITFERVREDMAMRGWHAKRPLRWLESLNRSDISSSPTIFVGERPARRELTRQLIENMEAWSLACARQRASLLARLDGAGISRLALIRLGRQDGVSALEAVLEQRVGICAVSHDPCLDALADLHWVGDAAAVPAFANELFRWPNPMGLRNRGTGSAVAWRGIFLADKA